MMGYVVEGDPEQAKCACPSCDAIGPDDGWESDEGEMYCPDCVDYWTDAHGQVHCVTHGLIDA